jgi:hypothetical protein
MNEEISRKIRINIRQANEGRRWMAMPQDIFQWFSSVFVVLNLKVLLPDF